MNKIKLYVEGISKMHQCSEDSPEYELWFDTVDKLWYSMNNEERKQAETEARAQYESRQED